jgi:hypothetical protein
MGAVNRTITYLNIHLSNQNPLKEKWIHKFILNSGSFYLPKNIVQFSHIQ